MNVDAQSYASRTMENMWHHVEAGDLNGSISLLRSLGYSAAAIDFSLNPDSYYFPNVSGQRIVHPRGNEGRIPIVTLDRGATYKTQAPRLHSLQAKVVEAAGVDVDTVNAQLSGLEPELSGSSKRTTLAAVHRNLTPHSETGVSIESQPTLMFSPEARYTTQPSVLCATVALHELVHIAQSLSDPFWLPQDTARKELEAYGVQAQEVLSTAIPYSEEVRFAAEIDTFRSQHLGHGVYTPDAFYLSRAQLHPQTTHILKDLADPGQPSPNVRLSA